MCATKIYNEVFIVNSTQLDDILSRIQQNNKTDEFFNCDIENRCHSMEWLSFASFQEGNLETVKSALRHLRVSYQHSKNRMYMDRIYRVRARAIVDLFFWYPYENEFVLRADEIVRLSSVYNISFVSEDEFESYPIWTEGILHFSKKFGKHL